MTNPLEQLRQTITQAFNEEELITICFDRGIQYSDLEGTNRPTKIVSLIQLLHHTALLSDFVTWAKQQRPHHHWPEADWESLNLPSTPPQAKFVSSLTPQEKRNRQNYLNNLYTARIEGVLHKSLYTEVLLELGKEYKPDAVSRTWGVVLKQEGGLDEEIPPDMTAYEIFVKHGRSLLILGEPGSGKSTVLLQLAEQLIEEARQDDTRPMPVVVNLSSWARERPPLAEWLAEEMHLQYQVPLKLGKQWLEEHKFVLLLDGLDEVTAEVRDDCVERINRYQWDHGNEIVVCSRTQDYKSLKQKFNLANAICLQPLTAEQIDQYLAGYGSTSEEWYRAIKQDKQLQELMQTPLILGIALLAYWELKQEKLSKAATLEERRKHLFDLYVAAMFRRRPVENGSYNQLKAIKWLQFIAYNMNRRKESEFFISRLQPDWLLVSNLIRKYRFLYSLVSGLIDGVVIGLITGFVVGLLTGLFIGLVDGLIVGFILGSVISLLIGLFFGLIDMQFYVNDGKKRIKKYVLRYLLHKRYNFPSDRQLIPFMNDMAQCVFLSHVGDGWVFKHRLLLEYFADQFDPADYERKGRNKSP